MSSATTVGALATIVSGRVVGDAERKILGVADLANAAPEHVSFLSNLKYKRQLEQTRAGAVLVPDEMSAPSDTALIICADPYLALARISAHLHPPTRWAPGVEPSAHVDPAAEIDPSATVRAGAIVEGGARIGARTVVGPGCYVGVDARIGDDVLLHPGAKVLERCVLGDRVILQAGAVIGSDGFGYAPDASGRRTKIPQVGIVEVEEDVEIGANTTIDRATFGTTRIGRGTKIDNLVQIAHNVTTGSDCVIVSQSGIAGSANLGDRVIIGAQGGVVGHIRVTDDVMLGARAGVANNVKESGVYSGVPIMPHREWLKVAMSLGALPKMRRRLRQLEAKLAELERASAPDHERDGKE